MLLRAGFSSWKGHFSKFLKLQTVGSCELLDPMCPTRIFSEGCISWLSPVSTEWFRVASDTLLSDSYWEDSSTSKSTEFCLFWRCFGAPTKGADGAAVLLLSLAKCAALEERCELWHGTHSWGCLGSLFLIVLALKPEGSRFRCLLQDPSRRLEAASTARLASFAEERRCTGLRGVGRCPSVRLPLFRWRFCKFGNNKTYPNHVDERNDL